MKIPQSKEIIQLFIHKQWAGMSVQDLCRTVWHVSKKLVHELRMEKAVKVNGQPANWISHLQVGDEIEITLPVENNENENPSPLPFDVLFEDEHLLIANKPAGMATHPNDQHDFKTLVNAVAFYLQKQGDFRRVRHIHRLDKDTTGAVIFAKNALSHAILDKMLQERKIGRTYWAIADGLLQENSGIINESIGRDRHHPTRRRVSRNGQPAVTRYRVLNKFPKKKLTLIECMLESGRTHQIRVHLSHIGHPLAGDQLYGGSLIFPRQALHARGLSFLHPFTLEEIHIVASFIDDTPIFESLL